MFGLSFSELVVIAVVALMAVGPKKLPGMLHTLGQWARRIRTLTTEVRSQTGIDEILRSEGIQGGLDELRHLVRDQHPFQPAAPPRAPDPAPEDPYAGVDSDPTREYPPEGPDSYGALADDLLPSMPPHELPGPEAATAVLSQPAPESSGSDRLRTQTPNGGPSHE